MDLLAPEARRFGLALRKMEVAVRLNMLMIVTATNEFCTLSVSLDL